MRIPVAFWCVLIACVLPIVCAWLAKRGMFGVSRRQGGYDNHNPRAWMATQTGARARANAAQANSFEALPFFIAAVLMAHQLKAGQTVVDILAALFVALRIVYIMMYVADAAALRSAVWTLAFFVNLAIFLTPFL
jgi:uncharacterized MAPEG superfamily protein